MTDLELLFLVLAVLYLWECAVWLRHGSLAVRTWFGRRWRVVHPGTLLANQHGAFVLAAPFPPLGTIFCSNQLPVSLSPDAVLAYVSTIINPGLRPLQTGRCFRFDRIQSVQADGKKLLVNGGLLLKASSPMYAAFLAHHLEQLRKIPAQKRSAAIRQLLEQTLDDKAAARRQQEFRERTGPIRWFTNALFGYLFLVVPAVIASFGFRMTWAGLLVGLLALTAGTALSFRSVHKHFFPEADDDRFTHFLTILLSPVTAIRAHDILSRSLLESYHPLAVCRALGTDADLRRLAEGVVRDLRFPAPAIAPSDPLCAAVEEFSREALRAAVEAALSRGGLNPDVLVHPPARTDPECRTYCPRCHAQFTTLGTCPDCGGVPLIRFEPERGSMTRSNAHTDLT